MPYYFECHWPFVPQGRGKVERFFRTVRDQFLCDKFKTVEQINNAFNIWVGRYHETLHSSLKCSPLQKRLQSKNVCRTLSPSIDIEALFRMEKRCRVYWKNVAGFTTIAPSTLKKSDMKCLDACQVPE